MIYIHGASYSFLGVELIQQNMIVQINLCAAACSAIFLPSYSLTLLPVRRVTLSV